MTVLEDGQTWRDVDVFIADSGTVFLAPGRHDDWEMSGFWYGCGLSKELWRKAEILAEHNELHRLVPEAPA